MVQIVEQISEIKGIPPFRKELVEFHDILYTLFRDMLYTSASAQASVKVAGSSVHKPSRISHAGNRHLRRALYMPTL
jgi:hypothetical protein